VVRNANTSLVTVEMDGVSATLSSVPQCRTCSSKYRDQVERHLGEGRTYMAIAALLPPDADLTSRNLRDHYANGHVDLDAPAVQRAAQQQGQALEAAREPLVAAKAAHLGFAHAVLARVAERLDSGEVEPEIKDGLAAAKLIAATEAAAGDRNQIDDYVTAMVALIDVVREVVPAHTFVEIGQALSRNPILKELARVARDQVL
jgi:hypothetical protein